MPRYDTSQPDAATGIAPSARLAITDLSRTTEGHIMVPDTLSEYFSPAYEVGARIHSGRKISLSDVNDV
jgi:hypothetical protein